MTKPIPVAVRGVSYPSQSAAAKALGVARSTLREALVYGWEDRIGSGKSQGLEYCPEPVPVRIRGTLYPSIRSAARALGVSPASIRKALDLGTVDNIGLRQFGKYPRDPARPAHSNGPITIGGRSWPSAAELSRHLGKNPKYVSTALRNGRYEIVLRLVMKTG